jgi:hypothetical protein
MDITSDPTTTTTRPKPHRALGILPFIGVLLFAVTAVPVLAARTGDWQLELLENGVVYLVGWAGIGAGISHVVFGRKTAASIGWAPSPFETEVGFADLAMGVAGVMAAGQPTSYLLAVIIVNAIFRAGCGIGHVRQMTKDRNFAVNNTGVILIDFGVPTFLVLGYLAWA